MEQAYPNPALAHRISDYSNISGASLRTTLICRLFQNQEDEFQYRLEVHQQRILGQPQVHVLF